MADYSRYGGISPNWDAFMAKNPQPELSPGLSPVQLREMTNKAREKNSREIIATIEGVQTQDFACPSSDGQSIPIRIYKLATATKGDRYPVYIYFHGGGFLFGTLSSEDAPCYKIVSATGIMVVNVCYRHSPEWKWPTPANDALDALNWVFNNMDLIGGYETKVIVGGRSAGATLAAGVVLRDKDTLGKNRIRGQILDVPLLCHIKAYPSEFAAPCKSSYEENKHAPILPMARLELFLDLIGVADPTDRYFSLVLVPDHELTGLPPAHFQIAGRDILRDEAFLYMEKLKRAGVKTAVNVYPGVPHGFKRYDGLEASRQWDEDHMKAIKQLLEI